MHSIVPAETHRKYVAAVASFSSSNSGTLKPTIPLTDSNFKCHLLFIVSTLATRTTDGVNFDSSMIRFLLLLAAFSSSLIISDTSCASSASSASSSCRAFATSSPSLLPLLLLPLLLLPLLLLLLPLLLVRLPSSPFSCFSSHSIKHSRLRSAASIASRLPSSLSFSFIIFFAYIASSKTTVVSPGWPNAPVTVASGYLNSPFIHATSYENNSTPLFFPSSHT